MILSNNVGFAGDGSVGSGCVCDILSWPAVPRLDEAAGGWFLDLVSAAGHGGAFFDSLAWTFLPAAPFFPGDLAGTGLAGLAHTRPGEGLLESRV